MSDAEKAITLLTFGNDPEAYTGIYDAEVELGKRDAPGTELQMSETHAAQLFGVDQSDLDQIVDAQRLRATKGPTE